MIFGDHLPAALGAGQGGGFGGADSTGPLAARGPKLVMPITLLDIILLGVMLVSALLAMIRGFMREVLSIAAWVVAAIATVYALPRLGPLAKQYFSSWPDIVATAVVGVGVFLGTLLIVSIITVRFSDMVLDSRVGALDRTLGFMFGLARGLIIVVVCFLLGSWLVPDRNQPDWVKKAKSRVVLQSTGDWLMSMLPDDPESTILKRLKRPKPDEDQPDAPDQQRGAVVPPNDSPAYRQADRASMQQLIRSNVR